MVVTRGVISAQGALVQPWVGVAASASAMGGVWCWPARRWRDAGAQAVKRLRLADLDRLIEDHITVTISEWGTLR
jgi:hypothetical protein